MFEINFISRGLIYFKDFNLKKSISSGYTVFPQLGAFALWAKGQSVTGTMNRWPCSNLCQSGADMRSERAS